MALGRLSNRGKPFRLGSHLAVELAPRHSFYDWCNEILAEAEFDAVVEMLCQPYYSDGVGRPSVPPGRYFRMLFVGQYEGLDSEREIAWRCADSLSLHRFLRLSEGETVPDHTTLSVTRSRLPIEIHHAVFGFVLEIVERHDLVRGRRIGVDASTQEANAALRRLVRRDTGEDYRQMLERLAKDSGIETPSTEDLIRFDRARKGKSLSNAEWASPTDPEARIARMKDGTTHLAYKPEHAVDLDTGAVVAAEVHLADQGDTTTITGTLDAAQRNLTSVGAPPCSDDPAECVADKGYHSRAVLTDLDGGPWKTRIAEPQRRGVSRWQGDEEARRAVYSNRVRLRSGVGQHAMRRRAELVERSFAHILDRGGMRRTWLRGRENVHKRYLIHVAGHNLGLLMRLLIGAGTPKEAIARGWCFLILRPTSDRATYAAILMVLVDNSAVPALIVFRMGFDHRPDGTTTSSTDCYRRADCGSRVRRRHLP